MKTTNELYLTDLVLDCAIALKNKDFKEAFFIRYIILNHYQEDFISYHAFGQFPYLMIKYKRFIPYHDLYFALRFLVRFTGLYETEDFSYVSPFVIE